MTGSSSPYRCPKCGNKGKWRSGVGFEHEMICFKCWEVWEPGEITQALRQKADELVNQNGDGI